MSVLTSCRAVSGLVRSTVYCQARRFLCSSPVKRKALEGWKRPNIDEIGVPKENWQGVFNKNQQKYNLHLLTGVGLLGVTMYVAYDNIFTNPTPKFVKQTGFVSSMPKEKLSLVAIEEQPSSGMKASPAETIVIVEEAVEEAVKMAEEVVEIAKETLDVVKETIEKVDETVEEVKKLEDETKAIIEEGKEIAHDSSKLVADVKEVIEEAVEIIDEVKEDVKEVVEVAVEVIGEVKEDVKEIVQEAVEMVGEVKDAVTDRVKTDDTLQDDKTSEAE